MLFFNVNNIVRDKLGSLAEAEAASNILMSLPISVQIETPSKASLIQQDTDTQCV